MFGGIFLAMVGGSDPRPRQFVAAAQSGVKDFQAWQALSRTAVQSLRHFKVGARELEDDRNEWNMNGICKVEPISMNNI
jgi:hypothetical protein